MSDRVTSERQSKAQQRAAAKAVLVAAAEAARRRRQRGIAALSAVGVVVLIAGIFLLVQRGSGGNAASEPTLPPGPTTPQPVPFPPVPSGADPVLSKKPTVKAGTGTLTALKLTELVKGTGPAIQTGQMLLVNYVGVSYKTGEEFDSSWTRSEAAEFQIGVGKVIPGWDQGLIGVKVGSRVQLDIPAKLAYGDPPPPGAPGGALRFVVDVLGTR